MDEQEKRKKLFIVICVLTLVVVLAMTGAAIYAFFRLGDALKQPDCTPAALYITRR
jgi:flagellar basal body-associated protein FliL